MPPAVMAHPRLLPVKRISNYGASSTRSLAISKGYRSGLEELLAKQFLEAGVVAPYEELVIAYEKPATSHKYTPDFELPNGIIIESKGRFLPDDRKKHLLIKQQHPHLDIRFVFTRSASRISKTSKTTYAAWCVNNGFLYADKLVPQAWLNESKKP